MMTTKLVLMSHTKASCNGERKGMGRVLLKQPHVTETLPHTGTAAYQHAKLV